MGHVHEAALAADLGDRLLQGHPARDLLLDEEADHLALVGGLHLLGHDHLDPVGPLARLERAGDLVVVGDRDRAQAGALGGVEQRVHGRGAVRRVVGVHVQVHVHEVALLEPLAKLRACRPVVAARRRSRRRAPRSARLCGPTRARRAPGGSACGSARQGRGRRAGARAARPGSPRRAARTAARARRRPPPPRTGAAATPPAPRRRPASAAPAGAPARTRSTPPRRSWRPPGAAPPSRRRAGQLHAVPQPSRQCWWRGGRPARAARSWRASRARWGACAARAGTAAARRAPPRPRTRCAARPRRPRDAPGRLPGGSRGSRPGSSAASARPWR